MRGYKVFDRNWKDKGRRFEVGQMYNVDLDQFYYDELISFYPTLAAAAQYHDITRDCKFAEVEAFGHIENTLKEDIYITEHLRIVREIPFVEVKELLKTGDYNIGKGNTGKGNTGEFNTGDRNTGSRNTGSWNVGDWNTGRGNSGSYNSGRCNSGSYNSGGHNSGDGNVGNRNSGHCNTGYSNTGDYNTGRYNTGNFNTGDFNSGDYNVGCFNTTTPKVRLFDKETDMTFSEWKQSDAYKLLQIVAASPVEWVYAKSMTKDERLQYPDNGYLQARSQEDIENSYIKWWDSLSEMKKDIIKAIPNFDADKFYKITGIRV